MLARAYIHFGRFLLIALQIRIMRPSVCVFACCFAPSLSIGYLRPVSCLLMAGTLGFTFHLAVTLMKSYICIRDPPPSSEIFEYTDRTYEYSHRQIAGVLPKSESEYAIKPWHHTY